MNYTNIIIKDNILNILTMSVNIFGSSGTKSTASNVTKNYVDSKFITLIKNLQSKIDKNGDLDMGGYGIHNVKDPVNGTDVANKKVVLDYANQLQQQFVDKTLVKNSVGLVPNLTSNNTNKSGYYVTASSELKDNPAYYVFNNNKPGWCVVDGIDKDFWIEITCPEPILIYKC